MYFEAQSCILNLFSFSDFRRSISVTSPPPRWDLGVEFSEGVGGVSGYTQETRDTPYVLIVFLIVSFLRVVNILSILRHYIVFQEKRKNSRPLWYPKSNLFLPQDWLPKVLPFFPNKRRNPGRFYVAAPFFCKKPLDLIFRNGCSSPLSNNSGRKTPLR